MISTHRLLPIAIFVGVAVLYLSTLTQVHTFDALSYILDVQRKPWSELFHPHHLAYGPLGALATWFTGGDAALAMQRLNALAGAIGSALLGAIAYRRWHRIDLAIIAALALSGTYAYWYYAVEVEVYTVAACFLLWVIWLIDQPRVMQWRWQGALGVAVAGACLFHQTNILVAAPLLVVAGIHGWRRPTQWRGWIIAAAVASGIVAGSYAWVMWGVSGFRDSTTALAWLTQYAATGWWGGRATLTDLLSGISESIAWPLGASYGIAILSISLAHLRIHPLRSEHAWMWTWILVYAVFFTWWEPDNIEFWIAICPLGILLLLAPLRHHPRWGIGTCLALGVALLTMHTNWVAISQRGDARQDLQRDIARYIVAHSNAGDLVLIPDGLLELYLPYYHQREHLQSVNAAMSTHGSWSVACAHIRTDIVQSQQAGHAVLVAQDFLVPSAIMQQRFALSADAVAQCLPEINTWSTPLPDQAPIPAYRRIAPPAEQLTAQRWQSLQSAPLGWHIINARTADTPHPGWWLQVSRDPVLISPILDIPMPAAIAVQLEPVATNDRQAQLFVAVALNQFDETRSLRWEIPADASEVILDLRQIPDVPPRLLQIRLDPVADGGEGSVRVTGIRIIPTAQP
jgi:hypothetical protein